VLEERYNSSVCTRLPFTESNLKWLLSKKLGIEDVNARGRGIYYVKTEHVSNIVTICRAYFIEELTFLMDMDGVVISKTSK